MYNHSKSNLKRKSVLLKYPCKSCDEIFELRTMCF